MNIENEKKTDRTIEIQENKILKLHKVIKRLLSQQESIEMIKTLQDVLFQSYNKVG